MPRGQGGLTGCVGDKVSGLAQPLGLRPWPLGLEPDKISDYSGRISMLRLSKKADYALMAMKHLAQYSPGAQSTSAREIAEQYDIPIELLAKVLQRLVRTGLLVSTQGTRGGY